ncbi:hypothetical protein BVRB_037610, partial [Beta vulgaris subsp. vulgaris]
RPSADRQDLARILCGPRGAASRVRSRQSN